MDVINSITILAINLQNVLGGEGRTLKTRTQDVLFTRKTRTHGRGSRGFFSNPRFNPNPSPMARCPNNFQVK